MAGKWIDGVLLSVHAIGLRACPPAAALIVSFEGHCLVGLLACHLGTALIVAIAVPGQRERNFVATASMVSMNAHLFDCLTVILVTEIDDTLDLLQDWITGQLLA